jgi:hypothetical protein
LDDWNFFMTLSEQFTKANRDPLLEQAKKILDQRRTRALVIDRDLLGEPGWDILLCAFIANRKGEACQLLDVAKEIDLSPSTTKRWADALTQRGFLRQRDGLLAISEDAEAKLAAMFKKQLIEVLQAVGISR